MAWPVMPIFEAMRGPRPSRASRIVTERVRKRAVGLETGPLEIRHVHAVALEVKAAERGNDVRHHGNLAAERFPAVLFEQAMDFLHARQPVLDAGDLKSAPDLVGEPARIRAAIQSGPSGRSRALAFASYSTSQGGLSRYSSTSNAAILPFSKPKARQSSSLKRRFTKSRNAATWMSARALSMRRRAQVPVVVVDHVGRENFHRAPRLGGLVGGELGVVEHGLAGFHQPLARLVPRGDDSRGRALSHQPRPECSVTADSGALSPIRGRAERVRQNSASPGSPRRSADA